MSQPIKGETKDKFMQRCMIEEDKVKAFDKLERYATCARVWDTHTREALSLYKKTLKHK